MPSTPAHRVEILTYPNAQVLDVTGPAQVFSTANELMEAEGLQSYEIVIVSAEVEVVTSSGIALRNAGLPDPTGTLGTLIVSGGHGVNVACRNTILLDWLRQRSAGAERIASVCSGAFLLAEAGLLGGHRVVTHWNRCAEFSARYPDVRLDPDPIFVRDGAIWTSAGVTAGIDLALAMVEADHGRTLALAVARHLVVFLKRPGSQAQFSVALALQEEPASFERLHAWIAAHLSEPLSLEVLADQAGMSLRSLCRRYRQGTGRTPAQGVELMRVEAARRLREDGASISRTAVRCGFGSTETMRRAFLRHVQVGPTAYRDRFHG